MAQVGVIGDSKANEGQVELAHAAGRIIAEAGHTLICGGREGVMEAACRGAREAGGRTIGILPGSDGKDGNEFLDVQIRTGIGWARNSIVANSSDVLVVIGGSHGTLSEMCYASFVGRPIIVIKGSGGWGEELAGRTLGEGGKKIETVEISELRAVLSKYLKQGATK